MRSKSILTTILIAAALVVGFVFLQTGTNRASAQKNEDFETEDLGVVAEYNARSEFALTQGGTTGVWRYGYTTNDASNVFVPYTLNTTNTCNSSPAEGWIFSNGGDNTPVIYRYQSPTTCNGTPPDSLFVHPGPGGERTVLRWVAPAAGTYQLTGVLQRANPSATTDIRILKNETTSLFTGNVNSVWQQPFNLTVTVAQNDTIDFSVGYGNGVYFSDGSTLNVTVSQPIAACLTAPANIEVNVPAENSPIDVQSVNTNAQLVGDATYTNTGKVGRAFEFDGDGDYVRIEDNAAQRPATAVTVEGWFKFDTAPGIVTLVSKPLRNSAYNSYTLYTDGGQLRGFVGNASQYTRVFSNFTPQVGVWHHLAFTYNFSGGVSTLRLFANGVEVTSGQDGTANLPLYYDANPYPLLIGGEFENNVPGFTLDGQADEVSVYGRALAQTEIFDIVQQGGFGKCPPANCAQTPQNLVSWFAGEQNALDSRSNNHGELQNGATFTNGRVGRAFSFDGVDDKVVVPNSSSLDITGNQLTIEAWINPTAVNGDRQIVSMATGTNTPSARKYGLFVQNGFLGFEVNTINGYYGSAPTSGAITPGVLTHVAGVYNGSQVIWYVNGVAAGSAPLTGNIVSSAGDFTIGQFATNGASSFQGLIDEVGIYNRGLSATEIQAIYNAGQTGKCKPSPLNPPANQTAWFTGDGETVDFTGLNSAGTLQGNTNYRVGRVGQSFNFDGSGDYITTADSANWDFGTGDFAIEAWFNAPNPTGVQRIISAGSQADGANNLWTLGYGDIGVWGGGQRINFAVFNGGGYSDFSSNPVAFRPNTWHHVAVVRSGTSLTFYLDGAAIGAVAIGAGYAVNGGSTGAIIGARYNNDPSAIFEFANGRLDEISVYKRALPGSEIAAVYNAGVAGKLKSVFTSPPVTLNEGKTRSERGIPQQTTTVELSSATVTFRQVTSAGFTSQSGIDLGLLPPLPSSVSFTGLAYDISTTAGYQQGSADDVQVCFNAPALSSLDFSRLIILHLENGVWINRTAAGNTNPNLCTDNLTSLSPFVIVQALAPTAANVSVSGRISDANGAGLKDVIVTLTDSQGASVSTRSNNFGKYSFREVAAGDVYTVSVYSKRYAFIVSSQAISVQDAVENVDFTADSGSLKFESIVKDQDKKR